MARKVPATLEGVRGNGACGCGEARLEQFVRVQGRIGRQNTCVRRVGDSASDMARWRWEKRRDPPCRKQDENTDRGAQPATPDWRTPCPGSSWAARCRMNRLSSPRRTSPLTNPRLTTRFLLPPVHPATLNSRSPSKRKIGANPPQNPPITRRCGEALVGCTHPPRRWGGVPHEGKPPKNPGTHNSGPLQACLRVTSCVA